MAAAVKTLIQIPPTGKDFLLATHIPFLDGNNKDAFTTSFQTDFKSSSPALSKRAAFPLPTPAQVEHKDLDHIKEYLTEAASSYRRPQKVELSRTPRWTKLYTNFKMPTDLREATFFTTQSQSFQSHPSSVPSIVRPAAATKRIQPEEKIPDSTQRSSFTPHQVSPALKVMVKHLEGFPTVKGDGRAHGFVSQYNDAFKGDWTRPPHPVEKHSASSVPMGDPGKTVERETTHAASFGRPGVSRPAQVEERLKVNLGDFSKAPWTSTAREAFHHDVPGGSVVLTRRNQNFSSVPRGDTDQGRNREMMSTTNSFFFSEKNHTERPLWVSGADLMTRSHVEFSRPGLTGHYFTTTAQEHYGKQDGERAKPATAPPSHILTGQEPGPGLTTFQADFLPSRTCRQRPRPSRPHMESHIKPPLAHHLFSTTHGDGYPAKPLTAERPANRCGPHVSHFVIR